MPRFARFARFAVIATVAVALAGCAAFRKQPKICPQTSVLSDAGTVTLFAAGSGRDLTDVAYEGEIAGVRLTCGDPAGQGLDTSVDTALVLRRGPAVDPVKPLSVDVPYFVAVVDRAGTVRDKAVFRTTVNFDRGVSVAGVRESFDVAVKLAPDETPADVGIVVGFQLTPEQLDYNRRQ